MKPDLDWEFHAFIGRQRDDNKPEVGLGDKAVGHERLYYSHCDSPQLDDVDQQHAMLGEIYFMGLPV